MALPGTLSIVHLVLNFLRCEHVRPKGNQEAAPHSNRRPRHGDHPKKDMIPMVPPPVFHVRTALGDLQACLLKETKGGSVSLQYAPCHRLTIEHARGSGHTIIPKGALGVP